MKIINNLPKLINVNEIENSIQNLESSKAPKSHASSVATTYGAGTASNFGHIKLSDSYITSGGTASGSVAASSKAVTDLYSYINNKLTQSNITNSGVRVIYDANWVYIRIVLNSYTQEVSTSATPASLPSNVIPRADVYADGMILNSGWHPTSINPFICFLGTKTDIQVRLSGAITNGVLIVEKVYPRLLFQIT